MALRTSRDLMAWQPPTGWRELSGEQRQAHLQQHGIRISLRPADWEAMDHDQRMAYFAWRDSILSDTPEARAAKQDEYRKEIRAWNVLMGWWILCLLAALGIAWGTGTLGEGVGLRIGITIFAAVGYTLAIFIPMQIAKPVPPSI
ncbi:hypothetical protein R3L02_42095 [Streptomyces scabiei]|uniref:hypothetical protein n=1 Tax=Streptomyces scabiei TaxID=1930 RepID=UPI00298F388B|nr:hypothetical protein [Streptomyces scabiei]MDW8478343.1 hypothetical protein [Streptomyces scabiei]